MCFSSSSMVSVLWRPVERDQSLGGRWREAIIIQMFKDKKTSILGPGGLKLKVEKW